MQATGGGCPYIEDGLIMWWDGIEKGNVANAWVDQIQGLTLLCDKGTPIFGDKYIESVYGDNLRMVLGDTRLYPNTIYSLEVCISKQQRSGYGEVFTTYGNRSDRPDGIRIAVNGTVLIYGQISGAKYNALTYNNDVNTIHTHAGLMRMNKQNCAQNGTDWWNSSIFGAFNLQGNTNYAFNGKIYSIRMYNRHLTTDEIDFNTDADTLRFGS